MPILFSSSTDCIFNPIAMDYQRGPESPLLGVEHETKTAKFLLPSMTADYFFFFLGGGEGSKGKVLHLYGFISKLVCAPFRLKSLFTSFHGGLRASTDRPLKVHGTSTRLLPLSAISLGPTFDFSYSDVTCSKLFSQLCMHVQLFSHRVGSGGCRVFVHIQVKSQHFSCRSCTSHGSKQECICTCTHICMYFCPHHNKLGF